MEVASCRSKSLRQWQAAGHRFSNLTILTSRRIQLHTWTLQACLFPQSPQHNRCRPLLMELQAPRSSSPPIATLWVAYSSLTPPVRRNPSYRHHRSSSSSILATGSSTVVLKIWPRRCILTIIKCQQRPGSSSSSRHHRSQRRLCQHMAIHSSLIIIDWLVIVKRQQTHWVVQAWQIDQIYPNLSHSLKEYSDEFSCSRMWNEKLNIDKWQDHLRFD